MHNGVLLHHPIYTGHQGGCILPLVKDTWTHKDGPYRCKFIERLGVEELPARLFGELEEATGEVVANCVAQDIGRGFCWCNVSALARGNKDKLALLRQLLVNFVGFAGGHTGN